MNGNVWADLIKITRGEFEYFKLRSCDALFSWSLRSSHLVGTSVDYGETGRRRCRRRAEHIKWWTSNCARGKWNEKEQHNFIILAQSNGPLKKERLCSRCTLFCYCYCNHLFLWGNTRRANLCAPDTCPLGPWVHSGKTAKGGYVASFREVLEWGRLLRQDGAVSG